METTPQTHLLVDGSNIVHAWPDLRSLLRRNRDAARSQLTQALAAIHDTESVRVTVVFDGRGPELIVESPSGKATFAQAYTPSGTTADDLIERIVAGSKDPAQCLVATGDLAERQTVAALGASVMSPEDLAAWAGRAQTRQTSGLADMRRENNTRWRR